MQVATGSQDKTIRLWNSSDLSLAGTLKGHKRGVWSVEFSPVEKVLASASGDKSIKIWSLADFTCLKTFEGHTASVLRVVFAHSGMQLLSSGADGVVKLWTIKSNECAGTFEEAHSDKIWALALSRDGQRLVSGGADSTLNVWRDVTAQEQDEAASSARARVLKEQTLSNSLRRRDYARAVTLAFELQQPRRLLAIFGDVAKAELEHEQSTEAALQRGREQQEQAKVPCCHRSLVGCSASVCVQAAGGSISNGGGGGGKSSKKGGKAGAAAAAAAAVPSKAAAADESALLAAATAAAGPKPCVETCLRGARCVQCS